MMNKATRSNDLLCRSDRYQKKKNYKIFIHLLAVNNGFIAGLSDLVNVIPICSEILVPV